MSVKYDVLTWDAEAEEFTEQEGMRNPCRSVSLWGVRRALRELRHEWGYPCNRNRDDSDPSVLVERVEE